MSAILPFIGPIVSGLTSTLGGIVNRDQTRETQTQQTQRQLIDQLLSSLNGNGPYSDLFNASDADFQRSFVDPAKSRFQNQIAPQIQQSFIQNGQQRGTGLEDTLTRAGVDLDSILNQSYLDYKQGALNRKSGAIGSILGQNAGVTPDQSMGQGALQGLTGYFSGKTFGTDISDILGSFKDPYNQNDSLMGTFMPPRKGFENDNPVYNPYTGVQQ